MYVEKIIPIVREAASLMLRSGFEVMEKGSSANLVTSSDLAVQHYLVRHLGDLIPGSGFLCEEEDMDDVAHEYIWVIDPIDGTANYARGQQDCCISVALAKDGEVCAGVVYSPWRDELYSAEKGSGAFCNGRPVKVSARPFEAGIICTAMSTYRKEYARTCSDIIYDVYMRSNDFRRYGSAAIELCLLGSGYIDLYFEMRLQPWDFAAASLVVKEAGGTLVGFRGKDLCPFRQSMVIGANNRENCEDLVATVSRHVTIDPLLEEYVEKDIIPRYASFDKAHKEDHVRSVISSAMDLAGYYDVDKDMVYAAAAFHDTGLAEGRETHHLVSGRIIREDRRLKDWFDTGQIETIAQAAEDHRASGSEPRSIYGKIIAEADRDIIPMKILRRTVQFGMEHYPELDKEGHWNRFLEHLHEKYYYGGYLKLFIPESPNAAKLEELRSTIGDLPKLREIFEEIFKEENENKTNQS